jgi:hypothetical protein
VRLEPPPWLVPLAVVAWLVPAPLVVAAELPVAFVLVGALLVAGPAATPLVALCGAAVRDGVGRVLAVGAREDPTVRMSAVPVGVAVTGDGLTLVAALGDAATGETTVAVTTEAAVSPAAIGAAAEPAVDIRLSPTSGTRLRNGR